VTTTELGRRSSGRRAMSRSYCRWFVSREQGPICAPASLELWL
jgi:hypothetical protein